MKTTGRKSRQLIVLALTLTALIGSTISTGFLQPSALADKTVQPRVGPGTENRTTYGPLNDPINLKRDPKIYLNPNDPRVINGFRNPGVTGSNTVRPAHTEAETLLAKLPLSFVENRGQSHDSVRFEVQASNHQIFFTPGEVVFASVHEVAGKHKFDALRMKFDGASSSPTIAGDTLLPGKFNFFEGQDSAKWITDVPSYNGVTYKQLYKGVDLVFRDAQGKLERDFVVAAGVDPKVIRMKYDGAKKMRVSKEGELVIDTRSNTLTESKPQAYQTIEGRKVEVEARYKITKDGRVGFEVGDYDRSQPLVIDPILRFSTFISDTAIGLAVDATGVYVTGVPNIIEFPATGVFGPVDTFNTDTYAAKLSPDGSTLIYGDIIRGSSRDFPLAAQVHPSDRTLYVLTETSSPDFPTTVGAFDTSYNGGQDYVVTRINAAGNGFVWSTYIGGAGDEIALGGIDVYNNGDCWFVGSTSSLGPSQGANPFPVATTFGTNLSPTNNGPFDGVAVSLSSVLGFVITSGFWGGTDVDEGTGVVINRGTLDFHYAGFTFSVDAPVCLGPGSPFPTCQAAGFDTGFNGFRDSHITRFTNAGRPIGSTFLGDLVNGPFADDRAMGIDIDPANNIYVGGVTSGPAFPTTPGAFDTTHGGLADLFVTKFNPTLSGLVYSTFIGGAFNDLTLFGQCIAVNSAGMAHIVGSTSSPDFPVTPSVPPSVLKGVFDATFTKLNPAGSGLILSAYIGGSDDDVANAIRLNSAGTLATIAGLTTSPDFPTTPGAFDTTFSGGAEGFVTQIDNEFSLCIQSPGDPNVLLINLATGAFKYCTPRGTIVTGTGTVTVSGCTTIISGSGANITLNTCSGFGFATVATPFGFAIISDPNIADNRCVCP